MGMGMGMGMGGRAVDLWWWVVLSIFHFEGGFGQHCEGAVRRV